MSLRVTLLLLTVTFLSACGSAPPSNPGNICSIFFEKDNWYKKAKKSKKRWGVPISVMMSFAYQESSFKSSVKPPRKKILGFIPGPRKSNSMGYSQATKETWKVYQKATGRWGADRDDFGDAMDFIGWYNDVSYKKNNINKSDAYNLYLAYHEGHGGFTRRTYKGKTWLIKAAEKVSTRSREYSRQLQTCQKKLNRGWFMSLFT